MALAASVFVGRTLTMHVRECRDEETLIDLTRPVPPPPAPWGH